MTTPIVPEGSLRTLRRSALRIVGAVVLALGLGACSGDDPPPPAWSALVENPNSWPTATPESQGLDARMLEQAAVKARSRSYTFSLLVIRNGFSILPQALEPAPSHCACPLSQQPSTGMVGTRRNRSRRDSRRPSRAGAAPSNCVADHAPLI